MSKVVASREVQLWVVRRVWEKEKSPSPTKRMRSMGLNGMMGLGWTVGFLDDAELSLGFEVGFAGLEYGCERCRLRVCFFALPMSGKATLSEGGGPGSGGSCGQDQI